MTHPDTDDLEIPAFLRRVRPAPKPVDDCDCADRAPASGAAYHCPKCDAEWPEETK